MCAAYCNYILLFGILNSCNIKPANIGVQWASVDDQIALCVNFKKMYLVLKESPCKAHESLDGWFCAAIITTQVIMLNFFSINKLAACYLLCKLVIVCYSHLGNYGVIQTKECGTELSGL